MTPPPSQNTVAVCNHITFLIIYCISSRLVTLLKVNYAPIQVSDIINPLNPELNPICYLLALLGAHQFLHVSRIRVKLLTLGLLMSYIYIYIWSTHS